ncbi:hypothetical protein [Thermogemmatispora sp.]|uniref:hypothetical protein n=1 Tax=Thermogemmatispora sp. TaxID=1968838 RepID=UPI001D8A2802|nr:hypothetical protein [Thermogemmatispora sp.]MBX5451478.1 hypothetical protein [Thermogemmatispora sp.]
MHARQATSDEATEMLVEQKLNAFARLRPEFETSFLFVQQVQGQERFASFPVEMTVRYFHALWICECKDRLLSVPKTIERYEGERCLQLLRAWQEEGETAEVVAFLQRRLDAMPFADLTRQIQVIYRQAQGEQDVLLPRLRHGRAVLLNRVMNLLHALDAIFALDEETLQEQVRQACRRYGHEPAQIEAQLAELRSPLYAYVPHRLLARENMLVMNRLGSSACADRGRRRWGEARPEAEAGPRALTLIDGYQDLTSTRNPLRMSRMVSQLVGTSLPLATGAS